MEKPFKNPFLTVYSSVCEFCNPGDTGPRENIALRPNPAALFLFKCPASIIFTYIRQLLQLTNSGLDNEKELFHLIAAGDEKAFERLYDLIKPKMIGYVIKLMKTEVAVMEVVQESMVRVWLNRDKLPDIEYPISWLFKIVANECFRYFRKNGMQQQVKQELQKLSTDVSDVTERELSFRETQRIIQDVVLGLPTRQREIYRLSRIEGLNMHEIAAQTGLSYRYVKKVLMAALKIIRQKLVETGRYNVPLLITALSFLE